MASKYLTRSPLIKNSSNPAFITKKRSATPSSSQASITKRKSMTYHAEEHEQEEEKKPKRTKKLADEEKRLRRFRVKAPGTYLERLTRVRTQRMFLIDRKRSDGNLEEVFDIAGSTGNIYRVTINKVPTCNCPDAEKGNQCKHIIYVLVNILKTRVDLAYQLAFLTTELSEIFANAPSTPQSSGDAPSTLTDTGGSRKPIEGDCPVCVMEFEEGDDIVWCKAACGNNIHKQCFEQWAKSKSGQVKCVYCRSPWKGDEDNIKRVSTGGSGTLNREGYVNVAAQLGLSNQRDTSTYHPYWVARHYNTSRDNRYDDDNDDDDDDGY